MGSHGREQVQPHALYWTYFIQLPMTHLLWCTCNFKLAVWEILSQLQHQYSGKLWTQHVTSHKIKIIYAMVAVSTTCEKFEKTKSLWPRDFPWLSRKDTDIIVCWRGQYSPDGISHCKHDRIPGTHVHVKISFLSTTFPPLITGKFKQFNVDCKEQEDWKLPLLFSGERHEVMDCNRLVLCTNTLLLRPVFTPAAIQDLFFISWIVNPVKLIPCDWSNWEDTLAVTAGLLSLHIGSAVSQVAACSAKNLSLKEWFASMVMDNAKEILNT